MLVGLVAVIMHRIKREMGFGYRFIQVLAIVEGTPSIVLLAILGILKSEAAAGLLGAILGAAFALKAKEE